MSTQTRLESRVAWRLRIQGRVQGVGYRPALACLAGELDLSGWVRNTSQGVEVHVEGPISQVQRFADRCKEICPSTGEVDSIETGQCAALNRSSFQIETGSQGNTLSTRVPMDLVVCQQCIDEVNDPSNRRYGYLLASCSQCGPRYTILEAMPYEREATSMRGFLLCNNCRDEYNSPSDRRFHAQTTCCSKCGPNLKNLSCALESLRKGKIIGIKGVGGYQLLVDAYNSAAIERLRKLKGRPEKPFAVMISSVQNADSTSEFSPLERALLKSSAAPIVVVPASSLRMPCEVSQGLSSVGLMLPTTALHEWLTRKVGPLVVTSGNLEGEPIAFEDHLASQSLEHLADVLIDHDRPIVRPIDDSVVRVIGRQQVTLRLARGLAPLTLDLGQAVKACDPLVADPAMFQTDHQILAVGGHQKVAIALSNGVQQVLGPHLGDMDTLDSRQRFVDHVNDLMQLYHVAPSIVVHDQHNDYFTTSWSKDYARENNIRTIAVQHHHAHIVAGMIEPQWLDRQVLGVAWDGTGLGTDGTIWGGEFLTATATGFERLASLRPFPMPGGEAAIREPWRLAAALIREVCEWDNSVDNPLDNQTNIELLLARSMYSPMTSSIGRLFDAVAALVLPKELLHSSRAGYEGHFAALLESCCDLDSQGVYPMPISQACEIVMPTDSRLPAPTTLDWRPLIRSILKDMKLRTSPPTIAMRFHRTLALAIRHVSELVGNLPVVLGGGVFQNRVLVDLVVEQFSNRSVPIAIPRSIPINDGGLAAGQLAIAYSILAKEQPCA
jgi:hydrogenase maturation protein HypF